MNKYIHQLKQWPSFNWDEKVISHLLSQTRYKQGLLNGFMENLGFETLNEATLQTLTSDVIKSTEIEGKILDVAQVRSSIAKRLGLNIGGLIHADRDVEGIVEVMLDATRNFNKPLSKERLFAWHSALFPTGRNGMEKIIVGHWRNDETGSMQVVSGPMGKEKIHFTAPASEKLNKEMNLFLKWFNKNDSSHSDQVLKSAIAHLWFVTVHPFDDGNSRLARAIADMQLTRSDGGRQRFFSMSAQIRRERKQYYEVLEKTQKGTLDITRWLTWFLNCMIHALDNANEVRLRVLNKKKFWDKNSETALNERQRLMINKFLDGFEGNLTSSKWAKIAKCSADTALRDIQHLIEKRILKKNPSGGRSTNYILK